MIDLSIITLSYNTKKILTDCIKSVERYTKDIKFEIIVIDNASTDGSVDLIKKLKGKGLIAKAVLNKKNLGFSKANNQGMKLARGRYVLLLNSDTLIKDSVLKEMVDYMDKNPDVGIASCSLKDPDGKLQATGGYFPTLVRVFSWMTIQDFPFVDNIIKPFHPMKDRTSSPNKKFYKEAQELDWVTGAFFLMNRKAMKKNGYLDEDYFMYTEEVDYCYRLSKRGWKVMHLPMWSITHLARASSTSEFALLSEYKGIKTFYQKHYSKLHFIMLRLLLKVGAMGRIVLFSLMGKGELAKIYVKAVKLA